MRGVMGTFFVVTSCLLAGSSPAAIVIYDFSGGSGAQASNAPQSFDPQVIPLDVTRGSGLTAPSGANSFNSANWADLSTNDYVSFGFSVASGFKAHLTTLTFTSRSSNSGPGSLALRSSRDGFVGSLVTWTQSGTSDSNVIADLSGLGDLVGMTEFRVFSLSDLSAGGGTVGSTGTWRIGTTTTPGSSNLLSIDGEVTAISAVPEPASWLLLSVCGVLVLARRV